MCSEVRKLSAVAAVLHSANGDPRIRCRDAIDENTSGVQIAGNLAGSTRYLCVQRLPLNPNWLAFAAVDGRINVRYAGYRRNGPKVSSSKAGMPWVTPLNTVGVQKAPSFNWSSPAEYACSFRDASLHLFMERVTQVNTGHGSHLDAGIQRIADTDATLPPPKINARTRQRSSPPG